MMKAAIRQGSTPTFTTEQPVPSFDPSSNANHVLLRVKAAAINPVDYKLPRLVLGSIYGLDVAGVVEQVGDQVQDFKVGDAVFGSTFGSLTEKTVTSPSKLAKKPESFTFGEAAALPIAYLTGLQGLRLGNVGEGSSVLVIGASGGCGVAALHLAAAMGATRLVGVCSGKNADFVKEQGATEVVDYTNAEGMHKFFEENAGKFDCVYDSATGSGKGEDYTKTTVPLLKEGSGQYVALNGGALMWMQHATRIFRPKNQHLILTDVNGKDMGEVARLMSKTGKKPILETMPFTEQGVKEAFERLKGRRTKGKIVFDIDSSP